MGNVIPIKGAHEAPKTARNLMETLIVSVQEVNGWKIPPFQRPLRVNQKVMSIAEELKASECIEGVITLGKIGRDGSIYVIDGQHRIEAFKLSGLSEVIVDIRMLTVDTMAEMADEFVRLNSSIVKMRPDDILRGLESSVPPIAAIRKQCTFVGYDNIRRGGVSPVLSMSAVIRAWTGSATETPTSNAGGLSVATMAKNLEPDGLQNLTTFLLTAHAAWGRDPEYYRLWGALNLTMCMWMWRRLVIDRDRSGTKRYAVLTIVDFKKCLMSVSANSDYVAWLTGRNLGDRDRSPCYARLKSTFISLLRDGSSVKTKVQLPTPAWASK